MVNLEESYEDNKGGKSEDLESLGMKVITDWFHKVGNCMHLISVRRYTEAKQCVGQLSLSQRYRNFTFAILLLHPGSFCLSSFRTFYLTDGHMKMRYGKFKDESFLY